MQVEWAAALALGPAALLTRPSCFLRNGGPTEPNQPARLELKTLVKEGRAHTIEVREGFFDVTRKGAPGRPLFRCYTRGLAELYFNDVEANRAVETVVESWR